MITINYLDPNPAGSPAVLLLHGLGANASSWRLQFEPLIAAGLRPIAPDAPGFGGSRYDGRGWTFRQIAANLASLLDELDIGPAHVVGLSMGGVLAQQFSLDFPQRLRDLALVSTFCRLRPDSASQWLYFLLRAALVFTLGPRKQAEMVARRIFPGPGQQALRQLAAEQFASADPRAYRAAMRALGSFDSRRRLSELRMPVLVITGELDSTVLPGRQKMLVNTIPGARQVIIPAAGHAVSIDQPEQFNQALMQFWQS